VKQVFVIVLAALTSGSAYGQERNYTPMELPALAKFDPSVIDASKDVCTDFYEYTCSKWIAAHPIPADKSLFTVLSPLVLYNQTVLRNYMAKAATNPKASGIERQVGNFWQSCMDQAARQKGGREWLRPHFAVIGAIKSATDLSRVVAYLHLNFPDAYDFDDNYAKAPLFGFGPVQDSDDASRMVPGVDQGGMALPSVDYYLKPDDQFQRLRTGYREHVQKMFQLAGEPPAQAGAHAAIVLEIETAMAKAAMDSESRRDPKKTNNKWTLAQLKTAVPAFAWEDYLKRVEAPKVPFYIVTSPAFLATLQHLIESRPLSDWEAYFRWWLIHRAAPYLDSDFEKADFAYFSTALWGTPEMLPPWRRCVQSADNLLGQALGQAYVSAAFPAENKKGANDMVTEVRRTLAEEISTLEWMSDSSRQVALAKQEATIQKIGYPDKWRDYSSLKTTPSNYLANMISANAFEMRRQLQKIGKTVDRSDWTTSPTTMDAFEDPQRNTITFPAAFLQSPIFDPHRDPATNLGAVGTTIGHEAIHGCDDQGRKFDDKGNLRDWWAPEDSKRYEEKDQCIINQYSQEIPEYGLKQDGKRTAGEDTADNGGLHVAMLTFEKQYKALGKSLDAREADGLTARQRFFLSYAFMWCGSLRPERERDQIVSDPHSLDRFRINRSVSNMPEFRQAFGCKEGQPMVHVPACRVW
jgi:putative endopeptidase